MSLTKKDLQDIGKLITDVTSALNDALEKRLRNDVYKFKDEILVEIQNLRDDIQVTMGYGDRIEDHEERISSLEQSIDSNQTPGI